MDVPKPVVVPLHGRGTQAPDWTSGAGSRILVFWVPAKPAVEPWPVESRDDSLHIVHNFIGVGREIWVASAKGVYALKRSAEGKWSRHLIAKGQPGEIKRGMVAGKSWLATVEPGTATASCCIRKRHRSGKEANCRRLQPESGPCAGRYFDRDGDDELIAGWRGKPWGVAL